MFLTNLLKLILIISYLQRYILGLFKTMYDDFGKFQTTKTILKRKK